MINRNVRLTPIDRLAHRYSIVLDDPELTRLDYKYGGEVNVKITKPEKPGTEQQNRAMYALLTAYYKSGYHSCPEPCTLADFKIYQKLAYGPPPHIIFYKGQDVPIPKSWADYSREERAKFIDGLISEIHQSGAAELPEIQGILAGMSDDLRGA